MLLAVTLAGLVRDVLVANVLIDLDLPTGLAVTLAQHEINGREVEVHGC